MGAYRDEEEALRARLAGLEAEHARLEGRVAGLDAALAEIAQERRALRSGPAESPSRAAARRVGRLLGYALGLSLGGVMSGGFVLAYIVFGPGLVSASAQLEVESSSIADLPVGRACELHIEGSQREGCAAELRCGGRVIFDGRGGCYQESVDEYVFWPSHGEAARDAPRLVAGWDAGSASLRTREGEARFGLSFERTPRDD